jgi:hypothetical protein
MLGFDSIDIREQLPRRDWRIGARAATTSLTWHYNGHPCPSSAVWPWPNRTARRR